MVIFTPTKGSSRSSLSANFKRLTTNGPDVAVELFAAVHTAIERQVVRSCHDLSEGGLAVAVAEMAFAGGLGVDIDLEPLAKTSGLESNAAILFSESNTRFLLEVGPDCCEPLEAVFDGLPLVKLGVVTDDDRVLIRGLEGKPAVDSTGSELKTAWQSPLAWG